MRNLQQAANGLEDLVLIQKRRPQIVERAGAEALDRILVFEAGAVVEQGSHAELLARPEGAFRRLHSIQVAGLAPAVTPGATEAKETKIRRPRHPAETSGA